MMYVCTYVNTELHMYIRTYKTCTHVHTLSSCADSESDVKIKVAINLASNIIMHWAMPVILIYIHMYVFRSSYCH